MKINSISTLSPISTFQMSYRSYLSDPHFYPQFQSTLKTDNSSLFIHLFNQYNSIIHKELMLFSAYYYNSQNIIQYLQSLDITLSPQSFRILMMNFMGLKSIHLLVTNSRSISTKMEVMRCIDFNNKFGELIINKKYPTGSAYTSYTMATNIFKNLLTKISDDTHSPTIIDNVSFFITCDLNYNFILHIINEIPINTNLSAIVIIYLHHLYQ